MSREDFEAIARNAKANHDKRVADNPNRIRYAIEQFEKHNIEYVLKNEQTGHFHCRRKSDDKLFQFYAGTGKIMGFEHKRGIHAPCKDCPKRYLGRHDSCPDYQAYHRANIERCKAECATKRLMSDNEICRKKEKNYFRRKCWK